MYKNRSLSIFAFAIFIIVLSLSFSPKGYCIENEKPYSLEKLLAISVEKAPSMEIVNSQIVAARSYIIAKKAYTNPEIELEIGKGEALEGDESRTEYSLSIAQPIEWSGKRLFKVKAAEATLEAKKHESEDFLLELRFKVMAAFYELLLHKEEVAIAEENLKTVKELVTTVNARVDAGESPKFELVKAKVEALKATKELRNKAALVTLAKSNLNSLVGNILPEDFDIGGKFKVYDKKMTLSRINNSTQDEHPLILHQQKNIEARKHLIKKEQRTIYPDLTLSGAYEKELDKKSYVIGITASLPLWYGNEGEIKMAQAEHSVAKAELEKVKIEIKRAKNEALKRFDIALDNIEVFEDGLLKEAEEAQEIVDFSYRQGESGLLDYIDARRVLRETRLDYIRAKFDLSIAHTRIERLFGNTKQFTSRNSLNKKEMQ